MSTPRRQLAILLALAVAVPAAADGGVVRAAGRVGPWRITAFTAPTPVRVGPVDVSVLVQDEAGVTVLDAVIDVHAHGPGISASDAATREAATNRMLHATTLRLDTPGEWTLVISTRDGDGPQAMTFDVTVEPPLAPWREYWPWFAVPILGLGLLATHQTLVLRTAGQK